MRVISADKKEKEEGVKENNNDGEGIEVEASPQMKKYFLELKKRSLELYNKAQKARKKGFDPEDQVEITLAANLAERVIGLISVVAPQIKGAGVEKRILELEKEYGTLDWRVAFKIALEVAQEKFCKFKDRKEAIEVGIRVGFAYVTVGVVSSPIEGFTDLKIRKRNDGKGEYFELRYAGPIRNAGGTAAAVSVLIADYVRKHLGYAEYDPTEKEIKRCNAELEDYHNYVTNLQYFPSKEESEFLLKNLPVCIGGDASEKYEVSNINLKDLPRVDTNKLRSGYCLIHSSCIPLKAPKLWAKLEKWGHEMGMEHWDFLGDFVKLQKKIKAGKKQKKENKEEDKSRQEAEGLGEDKDDKGSKAKEALKTFLKTIGDDERLTTHEREELSLKIKKEVPPDYTFIKDLVAGRPVYSYPLRSGGFRLRYGRSRASGYSGQAVNPATMEVMEGFLAIGTQLKVERPGKAAAFTPCDTIEGPVVKLKNGSVKRLRSRQEAKKVKKEIEEIIYLGDVLINYGDFFDRAHPLVPPGYCEEYWAGELREKIKALKEEGGGAGGGESAKSPENPEEESTNNPESTDNTNTENRKNKSEGSDRSEEGGRSEKEGALNKLLSKISEDRLREFIKDPFHKKPSFKEAVIISKLLGIPLHPEYLLFWDEIKSQDLLSLIEWVEKALTNESELVLPLHEKEKKKGLKRVLELLGVEHIVSGDNIVLKSVERAKLLYPLRIHKPENIGAVKKLVAALLEDEKYFSEPLLLINAISPVLIKDKSGIFIGARMGRPEKAKMRKLTGSPHVLFPVGEEGGRLRSFQSVISSGGRVKAQFPRRRCPNPECPNNKEPTPYRVCELCGSRTEPVIPETKKEAIKSGELTEEEACVDNYSLNVEKIFNQCLRMMKTSIYPDLIKGVRGTVNKTHIPEHLIKGILRAKHNIHVNKDGTVRYDASEVTLTHFKPKEIGVSPEKLRTLGYTHDVYGNPLTSDDQILELKCQDVVLPCAEDSPEEPADEVLFRTANFVDELLVTLYDEEPVFNFKKKEDLVGSLIIGLAPHTSAGILGRIIGFSKTQGFLAHPYFHAAMRRDCDGDEACFVLLMDAFLNFSKKYLSESRGSTMDAPIVLTSVLKPTEVDDMAFKVDIVDHYPLGFYRAAEEGKKPWEVSIRQIQDVLNTPAQFEGMMFTHDTSDINDGVHCSAYKTLPSMEEKIEGQMSLAVKIRACDASDVARLVIEKHFIRDLKGNLRKFSQQQFRCVNCNEKYRRPPLAGRCSACGGKVIFTISQGSVIKYLEPSLRLAYEYGVPQYLKEDLELTKRRVEAVFGKESERQEGLDKWFGA